MNLDDAVSLSQRAINFAAFPTARGLGPRASHVGTDFFLAAPDDELTTQPNCGFGAVRAGRAWKVAVRAWSKRDLNHPTTQWLIEQARGEIDIRITGVIRPRATTKRRRSSAATYRNVCRPLVAGHSVAHQKVTAGTLGAWVHRGDGVPLILSNNHVLANSNHAKLGDSIVQPGPADDRRRRGGPIGLLDEFVFLGKQGNAVDAALATVGKPYEPQNLAIPEVGLVPGHYSGSVGEVIGLKVQKTGRTTGHTWGNVQGLALNLPVDYGDIRPRVIRFDQVLEISGKNGPFSDGGDSGSLVADGDGWAVGLLFAGDDAATYANHIPSVLDVLKVDFL